jgi:hypothetical protein
MRFLLKITEMEGCIGLAGNHESIVTNEFSPRCQKAFYGMTLFVQLQSEPETLGSILLRRGAQGWSIKFDNRAVEPVPTSVKWCITLFDTPEFYPKPLECTLSCNQQPLGCTANQATFTLILSNPWIGR